MQGTALAARPQPKKHSNSSFFMLMCILLVFFPEHQRCWYSYRNTGIVMQEYYSIYIGILTQTYVATLYIPTFKTLI